MNKEKEISEEWFKKLRDEICHVFEEIEDGAKFKKTKWDRAEGGGGEMSLMKGNVFEKVGVNISTVYGEFSEEMRKQIPGASEDPRFWASGISLVAHMCSPLVPAVHMNTRQLITTRSWFGGGADLTPMYPNNKDTEDFHRAFQEMCDRHNPEYYAKFKKNADEYFYLPHRDESRGVGGIFYDYLNTGNWEADFAYTKDVGNTFIKIYPEIVRRHMKKRWTKEQRDYQLEKRGRYVEFNLCYDRGTKFGMMTKGNVDAYMMSMPPEVKWP